MEPAFLTQTNTTAEQFMVSQFSAHHAYVCETSAHWISAYFRRDALRLPQSVDEAREVTEHDAAWVRRRYPYILKWMDESNTSAVAFWT
jgi:dimethylaniline monooxygenase (N-oxide forming)